MNYPTLYSMCGYSARSILYTSLWTSNCGLFNSGCYLRIYKHLLVNNPTERCGNFFVNHMLTVSKVHTTHGEFHNPIFPQTTTRTHYCVLVLQLPTYKICRNSKTRPQYETSSTSQHVKQLQIYDHGVSRENPTAILPRNFPTYKNVNC